MGKRQCTTVRLSGVYSQPGRRADLVQYSAVSLIGYLFFAFDLFVYLVYFAVQVTHQQMR